MVGNHPGYLNLGNYISIGDLFHPHLHGSVIVADRQPMAPLARNLLAMTRPVADAALPRGAYVPFGAGSRTCVGMRFGQLEVKAIATRLLQRATLELPPGHRLEVRQTPTLGPRGGLPMVVRDRPAATPGALTG